MVIFYSRNKLNGSIDLKIVLGVKSHRKVAYIFGPCLSPGGKKYMLQISNDVSLKNKVNIAFLFSKISPVLGQKKKFRKTTPNQGG